MNINIEKYKTDTIIKLYNGVEFSTTHCFINNYDETNLYSQYIYQYKIHETENFCASAIAINGEYSETKIYYGSIQEPTKYVAKVDKDYCCGLNFQNNDLFIIYQRSILRIKDALLGNENPDEEVFIEMQDYYGYENPLLVNYINQKLICNIGGRVFVKIKNENWVEKSNFYVGSSNPILTSSGLVVYSTNYLFEQQLEGIKIYNPETEEIKFYPIKGCGISPNPLIETEKNKILVANASTPQKGENLYVIIDITKSEVFYSEPNINNQTIKFALKLKNNKIATCNTNNTYKIL
ncbi:MAG: hypothetical protein MJ211_04295 [Bacteroidales bacterium]|nr:hypothetical protein [Bacteroidales bacterium]